MRIRILPLIIVMSFILVVVKVFDTVIDKTNKSSPSLIQAVAQEEEEEETDEDLIPTEAEAELSPNYSGKGPSELEVTNMSEMEKNLLENLAKRRKELDQWSASISMKENILNATEKKINRKMEELETLKKEVGMLLKKYNDKESKKIKRLVKIYESMKAQNAADIFAEMEINILLEVISKMKEANAAKILGKMNANKAKQITTELAKQRRLSM